MSLVYISKNLNRSGYHTLKSLNENGVCIDLVILRKEFSLHNFTITSYILKILYKTLCKYYNCDFIKFTESEYLYCKKNSIPVMRVSTINDAKLLNFLQNLHPELIIIGGGWYGLVPEIIFSIPRYGAVNIHPSLLPNYRGTSITRWQILNGEMRSGITIHRVDSNFDSGDIIMQEEAPVRLTDSPQLLFERLSHLAGSMAVRLVEDKLYLPSNKSQQQLKKGRYYPKWKWSLKKMFINTQSTIEQIHSFIRANTQEIYWYLGPILCINRNYYIIRKTHIKKTRVNHNLKSTGLFLVKADKDGWHFAKKGDNHELVASLVQPYNRLYFISPACHPIKYISNISNPIGVQ
jgi:methionyl-tRNA formyltransferase